MASFADIQYCIYADFAPTYSAVQWVGESEKVQNHSDVKYGWSLSRNAMIKKLFLTNKYLSNYLKKEYTLEGVPLKKTLNSLQNMLLYFRHMMRKSIKSMAVCHL